MAPAPILYGGLILLLGAAILLWLITFSTPYLKMIYFLENNNPNGGSARFGVYGWCVPNVCNPNAPPRGISLAWSWTPQVPGGRTLTRALGICFPIATSFATVALLATLAFALAGVLAAASVVLPLAFFGFLMSAVTMGVSVSVWTRARRAFDGDGVGAVDAKYGPAFWMTIAATVALFLSLYPLYAGTRLSLAKNAGERPVVVEAPKVEQKRKVEKKGWFAS